MFWAISNSEALESEIGVSGVKTSGGLDLFDLRKFSWSDLSDRSDEGLMKALEA